jgi:hypothetical protein
MNALPKTGATGFANPVPPGLPGSDSPSSSPSCLFVWLELKLDE